MPKLEACEIQHCSSISYWHLWGHCNDAEWLWNCATLLTLIVELQIEVSLRDGGIAARMAVCLIHAKLWSWSEAPIQRMSQSFLLEPDHRIKKRSSHHVFEATLYPARVHFLQQRTANAWASESKAWIKCEYLGSLCQGLASQNSCIRLSLAIYWSCYWPSNFEV